MSSPAVKSKTGLELTRRRARARDLEVSKLPDEWRKRAELASTKAEQIDYIIAAFRAGVYRRGPTTLALERLWNLSTDAVVGRECEALRAVYRVLESPEELQAELMLRVEFIGRDALERTEEVVDKDGGVHTVRRPDHRTALAAAVELGEWVGLRRTARIEVDVRTLSDEQIRAQLEAHGIKVIETVAEEKSA